MLAKVSLAAVVALLVTSGYLFQDNFKLQGINPPDQNKRTDFIGGKYQYEDQCVPEMCPETDGYSCPKDGSKIKIKEIRYREYKLTIKNPDGSKFEQYFSQYNKKGGFSPYYELYLRDGYTLQLHTCSDFESYPAGFCDKVGEMYMKKLHNGNVINGCTYSMDLLKEQQKINY